MIQKSNLNKVVNNIVTRKDGSKEIQQNIPTTIASDDVLRGATVIIPATSTPTGTIIVNPNATSAKIIKSAAPSDTTTNEDTSVDLEPSFEPTVYSTTTADVNPAVVKTTTTTTTTTTNTNNQTVNATETPVAKEEVKPVVNNDVPTAGAIVKKTTTTTTKTTK